MTYFPKEPSDDVKRVNVKLLGNRFMKSQTMYEYMIEFLLVFVSAKTKDLSQGKMKFHDPMTDFKMEYWVEPRMGLKRFIFFDKDKKGGKVQADQDAYNAILNMLGKCIECDSDTEKQELIESLQDFYHGYTVVAGNRKWCAQAILPICPQLIFCEAMPNENARKKLVWELGKKDIDNKFDFDKRNFLSRGGEMYYLHLLLGTENRIELRKTLEIGLENLLSAHRQMAELADFIQKHWEKENGYDEPLVQKMSVSWMPIEGYKECGEYSAEELATFLACKMHPVKKLELLAKGIVFQVMRMMFWRIEKYLGSNRKKWIIQMSDSKHDILKKIASDNYREVEDEFNSALNKMAKEMGYEGKELIKRIKEGRDNSVDLFRSEGKELQCIIPKSGKYERFTLSEDIIRFLVLALIKPGDKMTLDMFCRKLYQNYGIIIAPEQYKTYVKEQEQNNISMASCFEENVRAFQRFLKATGFLKELSDATSIVVNPYVVEEDV